MQKSTGMALLLLSALSIGCATADPYLTVGGYFSQVNEPVDVKGGGGQIGIGYTLTDQWSLELGYDRFLNKEPLWPVFLNTGIQNPSIITFKSGFKSAGVTLSVLGKSALDSSNTLFYRVGAIHHTSESWVFHYGDKTCATNESPTYKTLFYADDELVGTTGGCTSSFRNIALIYGLGVDHQFNQQWFSRVEIVGIADPDAESLYAIKLAVGYRF